MILKISTKNSDAPIAEIKDASLFALFLLNLLYATTSRSIAADPLATPATVATKRKTPRKARIPNGSSNPVKPSNIVTPRQANVPIINISE